MTVIGHIRHLVGAESIGFADGIEFPSVTITDNQTMTFFHFHLKATIKVLRLGGVF